MSQKQSQQTQQAQQPQQSQQPQDAAPLVVSSPGQPADPPKTRTQERLKGAPVGGTGKLFRYDS